MNELIPIERKGLIILYGRIIGKNGRLGQYEVSGYGNHFGPYVNYCDAEKVYKKLIAPKTSNN